MRAAAKPSRRELWGCPTLALFDVQCDAGPPRPGEEFYTSAPCIMLLRRGAFWTRGVRGEALGDPTRAVLRNRMEPYTVRQISSEPYQGTTVRLSAPVVREMLRAAGAPGPDGDEPVLAVPSGPLPGAAVILHELLLREVSRGAAADGLLVEEAGLRLAGAVVRAAHAARRPRAPTAATRDQVFAACEYLTGSLPARPSLSDVAAAVRCSPWHLSRAFRAVTGSTVHGYTVALRLRGALGRVMEGRASLTAIAMDAGFADHSHFTRVFRREYGVTPSAARRLTVRDAAALVRRPFRAPVP